ncbi:MULTISPECIES: DUF1836 domain-containing protein [Paenibacillus]|jgi:hypothetical protein|uniref:DUF1836 domain-containing protein n=1 Tax=Paenibacillus odorifer TaxID=189426 RepID=A0A1R0XTF8_9BACL|nr:MULTISPECIES: DUF1836 domain-containing protein [Paenibacillus]AWV33982.1 hypothetical protein CD191_15925 [Paenibacillus odorifer]ETT67405.1 hypothetical protein C171_03380 [Paenibacillus sp. FSL H8-237]MEC0134042.1 DUF1836 domain-containing protein [Paenibacillus odorifer]MEC0222672.1 DUF1836 domain-containing protein [Paenibacillus odorifer]OMC70012.1 hypothetical protein BK121_15585 [Paenibacillus odorifer]
MESFALTRVEMSSLLLSLTGLSDRKPLNILQEAWAKFHREELQKGTSLPAFLSTNVPPILQKIIKGGHVKGFSLGEIASLGHLIEYSTLTVTAMQNWVKRDFKEYLGSPKEGKKYSVNQAALLFIIDDLKSALNFESIRQLFQLMFLKPDRDDDDLIEPAKLYYAYAGLFEEIKSNPSIQTQCKVDQVLHKEFSWKEDTSLKSSIDRVINRLTHLSRAQRESVRNMLLIATISVQTCYFQSLARQYFNAALFLDF